MSVRSLIAESWIELILCADLANRIAVPALFNAMMPMPKSAIPVNKSPASQMALSSRDKVSF